jgi:hypothetical protein
LLLQFSEFAATKRFVKYLFSSERGIKKNLIPNETSKVEKILKESLNSIPSPSVQIQIMGENVC